MGFILHPDGEHVLMCHRIGRDWDDQHGKWNGLGGKVEQNEDVAASMKRELAEEAQIDVTSMKLRGTVSWPGFGANGENHFGFIFVIDGYIGKIPAANAEGPLEWKTIAEIDSLNIWPGDRYFLPYVFDPDVDQFHACLPYRDGEPVGWSVTVL